MSNTKLRLPKVDIKPLTKGQEDYVEKLEKHIITFAAGLPGTGKTYLAVMKGLQRLESKQSNSIIISRPIVEAGEKLGYLPGSIEEKARPFMQPLFDGLSTAANDETIRKMMAQGILKICPLAYLRGTTFNNSYMILDEAQNATLSQIKMFITRIGKGSRIVICGDPRQRDLKGNNGFVTAMECLSDMPKVGITKLGKEDIVRNPIIADVVERLEDAEGVLEYDVHNKMSYKINNRITNGHYTNGNGHITNGVH